MVDPKVFDRQQKNRLGWKKIEQTGIVPEKVTILRTARTEEVRLRIFAHQALEAKVDFEEICRIQHGIPNNNDAIITMLKDMEANPKKHSPEARLLVAKEYLRIIVEKNELPKGPSDPNI